MKKREKKQKIIEELKNLFFQYENIFFISLKNLKVNQINKLRSELKNINLKLKVVKKTLLEIANQELKSVFQKENFKTSFAIIFSHKKSDLKLINIINKIKNEINLVLIGGYIGKNFYNENKILSLVKFKTEEDIYSSLISSLKNNLGKLNFVLRQPLIKFITVVNNIKNKNVK